jgi:GAF domain-containing protein
LTHRLSIPDNRDKEELYKAILPQVESLFNGESDLIANMANLTAVLKDSFHFFWVGFYLVKNNILMLGPFQGPVACTRIASGKGVCGSSWEKKKTFIIHDVDQFPGHIACSPESRSEIVVPGIRDGEVKFVLDIDSNRLGEFDETDAYYLQRIIDHLIHYSEI